MLGSGNVALVIAVWVVVGLLLAGAITAVVRSRRRDETHLANRRLSRAREWHGQRRLLVTATFPGAPWGAERRDSPVAWLDVDPRRGRAPLVQRQRGRRTGRDENGGPFHHLRQAPHLQRQ